MVLAKHIFQRKLENEVVFLLVWRALKVLLFLFGGNPYYQYNQGEIEKSTLSDLVV